METYAPIHPERPLRRASVALLASLLLHAAAGSALVAWTVAALEAARKAEAERPKEVALADLDVARWEQNRRVLDRVAPVAAQPAPQAPPSKAMVAPGSERDQARVKDGPAGERAGAPQPAAERPTAASAPATAVPVTEESGPRPGEGTLDLQPRAQPIRPLAMRFDPVGKGLGVLEEGTSFAGLTVQTPEAWRYTNFFGRAVEAMNSVYRYELGAPMPPSLHAMWLSNPRRGGGCSMTSVSIDGAGKVIDAHVRRSSGMADLDALIVEVIRRTAPFVNVPAGLVGAQGVYADTWGLCIMWGGGAG